MKKREKNKRECGNDYSNFALRLVLICTILILGSSIIFAFRNSFGKENDIPQEEGNKVSDQELINLLYSYVTYNRYSEDMRYFYVNDRLTKDMFDGYEKEFSLELIKKNPKAITILDAGSVKEATIDLAYIVDYVVCSHDFAEEFSGVKIDYENLETIKNAYDKLKEKFGHDVIITLESKGCFTYYDGYKLIPSIEVKAIDSTGAGDIFHGAFVYAISNGFDLKKTLLFSNITGALSVLKVGSRVSIPSLAEVINKYNDTVSQ